MKSKMARTALALAVFCLLAAPCVAAAKNAKPAAADPMKLMIESYKAIVSLNDYHHKFDYTEVKPKTGKTASRTCEFWWMKPDYQKLSVLKGENSGSIVAYNPSKSTKKIAAKQNGILIPGGMNKTDAVIAPFFTAGWAENIQDYRKLAAGGDLKLLPDEKINNSPAYKIQIIPKSGDVTKAFLWVDKKTKLPVKFEDYKGGKYNSTKVWYDIETNTGLKPETFVP